MITSKIRELWQLHDTYRNMSDENSFSRFRDKLAEIDSLWADLTEFLGNCDCQDCTQLVKRMEEMNK